MRNVLLVRAGALGDVLLLRPAVASLKRAGARVSILAPEGPGRVLVGTGGSEVDGLIPWDRPDLASLFVGEASVPPALRDELSTFDLAIAYTRSPSLLEALRGIVPEVIPWDPTPPQGGAQAGLCLAEPLARRGVPVVRDPPPCVPSEAERRTAAALGGRLPQPFLALHPGSGSPRKNWPPAGFARLVERLARGRRWLLVEGPADAPATRELMGPNAIPARELQPRVLGALLSTCGLFVGNDSGVSHLAAAFGAPVVALFGPTDPATWAPLGARVRALRSPSGRMEDLRVEDVEAACLSLT